VKKKDTSFSQFKVLKKAFVLISRYRLMQSDGHSFGGNTVLSSIIIVKRDEDSVLDQIYEKQIFSYIYNEDFRFSK